MATDTYVHCNTVPMATGTYIHCNTVPMATGTYIHCNTVPVATGTYVHCNTVPMPSIVNLWTWPAGARNHCSTALNQLIPPIVCNESHPGLAYCVWNCIGFGRTFAAIPRDAQRHCDGRSPWAFVRA